MKIIKDKERQWIIIVGSILQENNNPKMHALKNRVSEYMRQILMQLKIEIDKITTIVGDFNTPFLVIDK